ncbi:MAG TPA: dehypoxanthine futalosine cyclase, partial [Limnochordia bacterium]|nr:dehypoxanthine futalosine cyclase [Limnochordia bacterium]
YLDNVQHIQGSWFSEGKAVGVQSLHWGCDDFGSTLFDESVLLEAGFYNRTSIDEVVQMISSAGYIPAERDTFYKIAKRYPAPAALAV